MVCTLRPPHDLADEIRALGVPVHCLEAGRPRAFLAGAWRLRALLDNYDVRILHTQLFAADLVGRLARLGRRGPILITTLQSSVYERATEYLYSARRRLLDGFSARLLNDGFVAVSAFVKDSAVRNLGLRADRVRVIYNSVEPDRMRSPDPAGVKRLRRELGVQPHDRLVLTVGRLDPPKGHRFLLSALVAVRREVPAVTLLVVGEGPSRAELGAQARALGLADHVRFAGARAEIPEIFALADVFVLPTLSEGLPVTLLEALAAGVPAVASRIGPVEEVVEDGLTGFLAAPGSSNALASAILRVLNDPAEAKAVGDRGRALAEGQFSARRSAEALGDLYRTLAAGGAA